MALFPCFVGQHRYNGPQQSAYLGASNGGRNERLKKRLCPVHLAELVNWADQELQEIDVNAPPDPNLQGDQQCFKGHPNGAVDWALYVNVYPLKSEPRVWFGNSCQEHINLFLNEMGLTP